MKVVILAGGFGTRLSEYTGEIPKPMIPIGGKPILWHIMSHYAKFGHKDFVIALGYKSEVIRDYFHKFHLMNCDLTLDLGSGEVEFIDSPTMDWRVTLVDTGESSQTGTRLKRLKDIIGGSRFMLTYGDGLSDVNIDDLLSFHEGHGRTISMTAVRPPARFGEVEVESGRVVSFEEKPQIKSGWINGGFFVIEPSFFRYIPAKDTMLEREPLTGAAKENQLMAYEHLGFWQCMDTKRDLEVLANLWASGKPPWIAT